MESKYTQTVLDKFSTTFPDNWIENLNWSNSAKMAFAEGIQTIDHFREDTVVQLSKLVLSGDHLLNETFSLNGLLTKINGLIEDVVFKKVLKVKLIFEYQSMLKDLIDIIRLVKNHIEQTKKKYLPDNLVISANFFTYQDRNNRHKMVNLMSLICESCDVEYSFSYNELYINNLLLLRQYLLDERQKQNGELSHILLAVLTKVELLLSKLSAFFDNKKISYYHDWKLETIELGCPDKYPKEDFRFLFQKYLEPSSLDNITILEWQQDSLQQDVSMWKLAFLMRYYTKCTNSIEQIDNLLRLAIHHHDEYERGNEHNVVNDCASRSFLNYMYNSRFSFLCQHEKDYTYELMKVDLQKIESIQAQTLIYNYHPYQTALNYVIKEIESKLSHVQFEDISQLVCDLKKYYKKFKTNVAWCKKYQPYLVQLRYNFSSVKFDDCDFKTYCPSSFCRPLRFKDLDEDIISYASKIAFLENESKNQNNRKLILDAKSKIDNMEHKNMEQMGLFITITTFLVGLLSIFIGNDGSVSIIEKMHYVIALGCILTVFVCVGYFAVRDKYDTKKSCLFVLLMFLSSCSVLEICRSSSDNKEYETVNKQDSCRQLQSIDIDNVRNSQPIIKATK
jgi:hypothetical protein